MASFASTTIQIDEIKAIHCNASETTRMGMKGWDGINAPTSPPHSRQTPNTLPSTPFVLLKKISLVCEVVVVNILFFGCVIGSV